MGQAIPAGLAAAAVGVHQATLRRWRRRAQANERLARARGPRPQPSNPAAATEAAELVRALAGQVGAESLRRSVAGLSRRRAAEVKREVCRALERERKGRAARITVSVPGVLRGFDAMHLRGRRALLVACDGSVPYRTSWTAVARYDGEAVATLLERDIAEHGAPLVLRMDRARQHATPAVRDLLAKHQVLLLQGPPRRPQYYGQLERQNREHRAWLLATGTANGNEVHSQLGFMMDALNGRWRRRTLDWRTAAEAWHQRSVPQIDRAGLQQEVERQAHSLRQDVARQRTPGHVIERLAIEHVLESRGLIRRERGGWC